MGMGIAMVIAMEMGMGLLWNNNGNGIVASVMDHFYASQANSPLHLNFQFPLKPP